ncbi:Oidioi.mRNA.OKI2018_I69.PAR.g13035.t1.cds [Oikopleura dioica]|uniref:Oidioi.mRNA.OKI2018_I69.PAR.g13035.t1.cds n=1 Tax=Oikopleura dioica TaxID=34765 RepID=A0ABN7S7D2_OIKDI|nr:Oidioi.mRNA.OKI2018_I69.PAR.g13035.t1.cds [Oikopleura dioica]
MCLPVKPGDHTTRVSFFEAHTHSMTRLLFLPLILIALLFVICMAASSGFATLMIGRAIVGTGLGVSSMSIPLYLSECAPSDVRGKIVTVNNLSITGGQLIAALIDGAFSKVPGGWRWMLGLAFIPAVIQFLGFIFLMPESPRYIIEHKTYYEAKEVLAKIRADDDVDEELDEMKREVELNKHSNWRDLFKTKNGRHASFIGCCLQLFQQLVGINTVMYYSATIIYMSGMVTNPSAAIWLAALTASVNFGATLIGLFSIERIGRRILALISVAGSFASLLLLSGGFYWNDSLEEKVTSNGTDAHCNSYFNEICGNCVSDASCGFCSQNGVQSCLPVNQSTCTNDNGSFWSEEYCPKTTASWMPLLGMILYLFFFASGMGPVPWAVNSEIFPHSCREAGIALSTTVNWLSNCIISLTFLSLLEAVGTAGGFLVYSIFALVALIVLFLFLPETKSVPLEDIAEVLEEGWIVPFKRSCNPEENDLQVLVDDTDD